MKATISGPACAPRHDQPATARDTKVARLRYQLHVGPQRAWFATPSVDLLTLVIADAIKRKTQAEIQRPALHDAYETPVPRDRNGERDEDIRRRESDDAD
ncbi:MAG TPA: hypothetical protein VF573_09245 [Paraburkholderia sp.]|uniref:hypothetical protein n=1 Tax=Paraburkholderia sp. TaxID=1926495 RepID=UPI002ED327A1